MKIKCIIEKTNSVKNGFKIVLALSKDQKIEFLKHQVNFEDKPLIVDFQVDAAEQAARLAMISPEQRRKIYALFRDIASQTGNNEEAVKLTMKGEFREAYDLEDFSLSNCDSNIASDFIVFLVSWCFMNAVDLQEHPKDLLEDIEVYLYLCLKYKRCAACGKPGEMHHWNAIGAGRDRRKVDDKDLRKLELCREHHSEIEQIGRDTFEQKYHVTGIIFNE